MPTQTKWSIDPTHSEISFKIRHLMIAYVKGGFQVFEASIYTTDKDFTTAEIDLWIDTSSINTGDANRDEHLKGKDFFDADNYKQIHFTSSTIENSHEADKYTMWGELTIKEVKRTVKLDVEFGGIQNDPWGNEKAGFTVSGKIKRSEWELSWNAPLETGGLLVSDEVSISCEIELINIGNNDLTMELDPHESKTNSL